MIVHRMLSKLLSIKHWIGPQASTAQTSKRLVDETK
jgi:hypothetical protein